MNAFLTKFHKSLREQKFSNIYLNHGGCGRAAVCFYKYFRKRKDIQVLGIKILSSRSSSKKSAAVMNRKAGVNLPDYFYHLVLAIQAEGQTYYVDGVYGVVKASEYLSVSNYNHLKAHQGYIRLKLLEKYNNSSCWNSTFIVRDIKQLKKFLVDFQ